MGHIDKGNAQLLVHRLQLDLHLLAHLQVQGPQGLVQKKDLGFVHQGPGYGDTLLLSAGKRRNTALLKAFEIHQIQHMLHLVHDLFTGKLLQLQAEGDILEDVHVREKRIALEYRIDRSLIGGQGGDIAPVQKDAALRRHVKTRDHTQRRGLPATGRPQEGDKFTTAHRKIKIFDGDGTIVVKAFGYIFQFDDIIFCHQNRSVTSRVVLVVKRS